MSSSSFYGGRILFLKILRAVYRRAPIPQATREMLHERILRSFPRLLFVENAGQAKIANDPRRARYKADERALNYVAYEHEDFPRPLPAMLVAFYLPQFHAIPENDQWWGKGFTEWRNVTRALPQFEGHVQPRLPGELGFYDLRQPEVMREQARLAREYGIGAFCFYFYWFHGKTLLEGPLLSWLADASIDLQFCLCWANEKWSRRWDGRGDDVLIEQHHSPEDDLAFIAHVAKYLRDPRYLRKEGKPILLVYRPGLLPDSAATAARWREWCRVNGIGEIHLVYVQSFERPVPEKIGFDAAVGFPPNLSQAPSVLGGKRTINPSYSGEVLDWRVMAHDEANRPSSENLYPGVNPSWDNEARRPGAGRTFLYSSPRRYGAWLEKSIRSRQKFSPSSRLVFINAWNEWAEGAVLEPDARHGFAYLQATRDALNQLDPKQEEKPARGITVVLHVWFIETFDEIIQRLRDCSVEWHLFITTTEQHVSEIDRRLSRHAISYEILVCENRGRDILPFLKAAQVLLRRGTDLTLKLHTKRSLHRQDGDLWRQELVDKLVGNAPEVIDAYNRNPSLGLVGPANNIQRLEFYWGANAASVDYLCHRIGIRSVDPAKEDFISGSMFWARLTSLLPLLDAGLSEFDFEGETGQIDGTLAHAVERIFGICAKDSGFMVCDSASVVKMS